MSALLHIAAFWADDDYGPETVERLAGLKRPGTAGAVVTFNADVVRDPGFRHILKRLDLAEAAEAPE